MVQHYLVLFSFLIIFLHGPGHASAQVYPEGAKPKISINGSVCAIENQQFSCTTRNCDSIIISEGDSIRFCSDANIDLFSDTAYYMKWDFTGSSNYPSTVLNSVPSSLPICYAPVWNLQGNYMVNILYNGWLSAYPGRDCYNYGPSHWTLNVIVLSASGVKDQDPPFSVEVFPNPAAGLMTIEAKDHKANTLKIFDLSGQEVAKKQFTGKTKVDVSTFRKGLFLIEVFDEKDVKRYSGKVIIE
jgi:hypothetical protein